MLLVDGFCSVDGSCFFAPALLAALAFALCDEAACCDSADRSELFAGLPSAVSDCRPVLAVRASGCWAVDLLCDAAGLEASFFAIWAALFADAAGLFCGCFIA